MATADHWRHIASSTEVAPGILAMSHDERSYAGKRPSRRSANVTMAVDGSRLQALRQQTGMTQEQLATATGFSDRLIRKAEASAPLRQTTISTIAQALSKRGRPVTVADLVLSPEAIALDVVQRLFDESESPVDVLQTRTASEFMLHVVGEELAIPFAGTHKSTEGYLSFRNQLLKRFPDIQINRGQIKSFQSPEEVCLHLSTSMSLTNAKKAPKTARVQVWWFAKVKFEGTVITKIELMYDTGLVHQLLKKRSG